MIDTAAIWSSMFWFYYTGQGLNDDVIQWMAQAYSEKKIYSGPVGIVTYNLPISFSDTLPLSYRRLTV